MSGSIIRAVGYTGTRQQLTWPTGWFGQIKAYVYGAGGGSGGGDGGYRGGAGGGGGYAESTFSVSAGDVLEVSVGRYGGAGLGGQRGSGGGSAGPSMAVDVWNTRVPSTNAGQVPAGPFPAWGDWMNTYAIWASGQGQYPVFEWPSVYFPYTGTYTVFGGADDDIWITVDGIQVLTAGQPYFKVAGTVTLVQGFHSVGVIIKQGGSSGGPGGAGQIIYSVSGGRGGNAGGGGSSGAAGGGGGASLIWKNGELMALASGGSGGGGAGVQGGDGASANAPYTPQGNSTSGAGEDGDSKSGDGGGAGGGGGGYRGANGGDTPAGDVFGTAGGLATSYSLGGLALQSYNQQSAGANQPYYVSGVGLGGNGGGYQGTNGGNGYIVLEIQAAGVFIKEGGTWEPVKNQYIKYLNAWRSVQTVWTNQNGVWQPSFGSQAPNFVSLSGGFGVASRSQFDEPGPG